MLFIEVYAKDFKRIIQANDFIHAMLQFSAMHPNEEIVNIKRI